MKSSVDLSLVKCSAKLAPVVMTTDQKAYTIIFLATIGALHSFEREFIVMSVVVIMVGISVNL